MSELENALQSPGQLHREQVRRLNISELNPATNPLMEVRAVRKILAERRAQPLISMLYEGLMRLGPTGEFEPGIAERFDLSSDGLTYTFHLRPSYWSNGEVLNAAHLASAWKKQLDPAHLSSRTSLFHPIRNAAEAKAGALPQGDVGIRVIDDATLQVELAYPTPYFLELVAHWMYSPVYPGAADTSPKGAPAPGGQAPFEPYICNGPFRPASSQVEGRLVLERNPHYWDTPSILIDRVEISMCTDASANLSLFEKGSIDWLGEPLSPLPFREMRERRRFYPLQSGSAEAMYWLWFNVDNPALSSPRVRRSFALALDLMELQDTVLQEGELPANGFLPGSLALLPDRRPPLPDVRRAKQELLDALRDGVVQESDLAKLTLSFPLFGSLEEVAREMISQWRQAFGIEIGLRMIPANLSLAEVLPENYGLAIYPLGSWLHDPSLLLETFLHRENPWNAAHWADPRFAQLVNEARRASSEEERKEMWLEVERLLFQESPAFPIFYHRSKHLRSSRLQSIAFSKGGKISFNYCHIGPRPNK